MNWLQILAVEVNQNGVQGYYYTMAGMLIIIFVLNKKSRKKK